MRYTVQNIVVALVLPLALAALLSAAKIQKKERDYQSQNFSQWWGTELVWKFDELPATGSVPKYRIPYSGNIYLDKAGGTVEVLAKYDRAFNRDGRSAAAYEQHDIAVHKEEKRRLLAFLGPRRVTPHWAGHCNGWTAAAIRHAEPRKNVTRNGVVFTPEDIKGLLAELYVYTDIEFLGGIDAAINPATLHVIVSNWVGRGEHPIGMDHTVGKEVWNYPVYAYSSSSARRDKNTIEVRLNLGYVDALEYEMRRAPRNFRYLQFHYLLDVDDDGNIVGGRYLQDSEQIDMLWTPLRPTQGGQEGNEEGNPYLKAKSVLALWRESVPASARENWWNIDPLDEDAIVSGEEEVVTAEETQPNNFTDITVPRNEAGTSDSAPAPVATAPAATAPAVTSPRATSPATPEATRSNDSEGRFSDELPVVDSSAFRSARSYFSVSPRTSPAASTPAERTATPNNRMSADTPSQSSATGTQPQATGTQPQAAGTQPPAAGEDKPSDPASSEVDRVDVDEADLDVDDDGEADTSDDGFLPLAPSSLPE